MIRQTDSQIAANAGRDGSVVEYQEGFVNSLSADQRGKQSQAIAMCLGVVEPAVDMARCSRSLGQSECLRGLPGAISMSGQSSASGHSAPFLEVVAQMNRLGRVILMFFTRKINCRNMQRGVAPDIASGFFVHA